jgi:hypothetical protein
MALSRFSFGEDKCKLAIIWGPIEGCYHVIRSWIYRVGKKLKKLFQEVADQDSENDHVNDRCHRYLM